MFFIIVLTDKVRIQSFLLLLWGRQALIIIEPESHKMVWVWRDFKDHLVLTLCQNLSLLKWSLFTLFFLIAMLLSLLSTFADFCFFLCFLLTHFQAPNQDVHPMSSTSRTSAPSSRTACPSFNIFPHFSCSQFLPFSFCRVNTSLPLCLIALFLQMTVLLQLLSLTNGHFHLPQSL